MVLEVAASDTPRCRPRINLPLFSTSASALLPLLVPPHLYIFFSPNPPRRPVSCPTVGYTMPVHAHRAPAWRFLATTEVNGRLRLSCAAPGCSYRARVANITRATAHLLACPLAKHTWPGLAAALSPRRLSDDAPPPSCAEIATWAEQCAALMFQSGLAFGTFDNPRWRAFFLTISGGRFSGPGDRRAVGGSLLQPVFDWVFAQVLAVVAAHHGRTLTCDDITDANSRGAYNLIACAPVPFTMLVFRLGVNPSTAENLLNGLVSSLPQSLTEPQPVSALLRGRDIPKARLDALLGFPFWATVTDNASNMVLMRNKAVESGLSIIA